MRFKSNRNSGEDVNIPVRVVVKETGVCSTNIRSGPVVVQQSSSSIRST